MAGSMLLTVRAGASCATARIRWWSMSMSSHWPRSVYDDAYAIQNPFGHVIGDYGTQRAGAQQHYALAHRIVARPWQVFYQGI